ncbi:MAG: hypothetical protein JWP87_3961 [Labilithrix sp.]|nr:hypothetical protein [Labilithrix sp.]
MTTATRYHQGMKAARSVSCLAWFGAGIAIMAVACGGAIDSDDLFGKGQGTTSGTSGGTTTPAPTTSATTSPTPAPVPPTPKPTTKCDVSFKQDVLDVFANAKCSTAACHGPPATLNEPGIDANSAPFTYKTITTFKLSTGQPYVVVGSTDPKASGMYCNLRGDCGARMPVGDKLSSNDLDVIDTWLACGAPFN